MKTLDSLIERFESAVAEHGVQRVAPEQVVADWEAETKSRVTPAIITELLRVWIEYRVDAKQPVTPGEAIGLFPDVSFSTLQLQSLDYEYQRLLGTPNKPVKSPAGFPMEMSDLPAVGETWDGFLLLEALGEGAFARVYLARQLAMAGRLVALKLTYRTTQESQLLARLHHSAIVPIFSMHHQQRVYGLCMPYLGNTTLLDLLREILPAGTSKLGAIESTSGGGLLGILVQRQEKMSTVVDYFVEQDTQQQECGWSRANGSEASSGSQNDQWFDSHPDANASEFVGPAAESTPAGRPSVANGWQNRVSTAKQLSKLDYVGAVTWIGSQLADALDHAHRHGVLHCDIKPANVLLAPDGQARLLDFNVSLEQRDSKTNTRVGGTMAYMAPEHLAAVLGMGKPQLDARSDIYSLGIVLFEMLAGAVPRQHASDEELPIRQLLRKANPAVTPALAAIIGKCVANRVDRRYSSAGQLYDDLNAQCNNLPLVHQPEPSLLERSRKWVRRHPMLTSISTISLVSACLLAISVMGFVWRGNQLGRLERAQRSDQVRQLLPEVIALVSATRNYPELAAEARTKSEAVISLLRSGNDDAMDLSLVKDPSPLRTLVRLSRSNELVVETANVNTETSSDLGLHDFSNSIIELETAIGDLPAEDTLETQLLDAYLAGRFSNALELGKQLPDSAINNFATWMFLGQSNLKLGDFAAARECFSTCITLRPTIEVAWFYRGIARLESKNYAAAIGDFSQAIAIRPHFPSARYNMALAFEAQGESQSALEALDPAIVGGWCSVSGFALRSNLHRKLGDKAKAAQDHANALACVPTTELDWTRRGTMRLRLDPAEAQHDFEQALRLNPNSLAARQNLAHVFAELLSQPEQALIHLSRLIEVDSTNAERWASRGVILARLGRMSDALTDLGQAAKILSQSSAARVANPLVAYQVACGYSLVAAQLENKAADTNLITPLPTNEEQPEILAESKVPSLSQITTVALKWYKFALQNRADVAQIAMTDPDLVWLRARAEFVKINRTIESAIVP